MSDRNLDPIKDHTNRWIGLVMFALTIILIASANLGKVF